MQNKVVFIGAGSMAEALIAGIISTEYLDPEQVVATNKTNQNRLDYLKDTYNISVTQNKQEALSQADVVVLAMKPKDVELALKDLQPYLTRNHLILSVLAGITTNFMEKVIGFEIPVIRSMPNTSAMVGKSATAITKGSYASEQHVEKVQSLLNTIGTTIVVKEEDMHAITALAGSGPAFYYYMVESMEKAAEEVGLESEIAKPLIMQTIAGVVEMLQSSSDSPSELRRKITSPGGTTQAGLETLDNYHFQEAIMACIKNAATRSEELGKQK
ncbi:pyrroline-5-carboxylate reductase [Aquibacillus koreensis]|uniref:Pyrroline-5-carboxylate reductase n=1 Tax=Aquibacillus koreensis TaxID=279446 RepID=A0A9X3WQ89_9BACI|nr:pyrroline-5-carboxylate reductase [Aquibacillus koreensis]MCT2536964.1 pyrroline-5-carboxylate reductase [Aquibacillus koreensis]MDC3422733.1 pyrroline-5-carboxylate reductase [Aquibacillus koreensis]